MGTRIQREEFKEDPNFDIGQSYKLSEERNAPTQIVKRGKDVMEFKQGMHAEESSDDIEPDSKEWNPYLETSSDDDEEDEKEMHIPAVVTVRSTQTETDG